MNHILAAALADTSHRDVCRKRHEQETAARYWDQVAGIPYDADAPRDEYQQRLKYSQDQPRDSHGRWAGAANPILAALAGLPKPGQIESASAAIRAAWAASARPRQVAQAMRIAQAELRRLAVEMGAAGLNQPATSTAQAARQMAARVHMAQVGRDLEASLQEIIRMSAPTSQTAQLARVALTRLGRDLRTGRDLTAVFDALDALRAAGGQVAASAVSAVPAASDLARGAGSVNNIGNSAASRWQRAWTGVRNVLRSANAATLRTLAARLLASDALPLAGLGAADYGLGVVELLRGMQRDMPHINAVQALRRMGMPAANAILAMGIAQGLTDTTPAQWVRYSVHGWTSPNGLWTMTGLPATPNAVLARAAGGGGAAHMHLLEQSLMGRAAQLSGLLENPGPDITPPAWVSSDSTLQSWWQNTSTRLASTIAAVAYIHRYAGGEPDDTLTTLDHALDDHLYRRNP